MTTMRNYSLHRTDRDSQGNTPSSRDTSSLKLNSIATASPLPLCTFSIPETSIWAGFRLQIRKFKCWNQHFVTRLRHHRLCHTRTTTACTFWTAWEFEEERGDDAARRARMGRLPFTGIFISRMTNNAMITPPQKQAANQFNDGNYALMNICMYWVFYKLCFREVGNQAKSQHFCISSRLPPMLMRLS